PIFLHSINPFHLFCNMLVLYWAGSRMEEHYGSRELVALYLTAGVMANVGNFLIDLAEPATAARGLGASGAVAAVMVVFAFHYPHQRVLLFFVLPMPIWAVVVLFIALSMAGVFGNKQDGV